MNQGFARAYAPDVGEYAGIDQETFLTFLKNFHKSSQASPIFGVIQISADIVGFAWSAIAVVVTAVAAEAAKHGAKIQERSRTNSFLDKMNRELFMPVGLFAMIDQYDPNADPPAAPRKAAAWIFSHIESDYPHEEQEGFKGKARDVKKFVNGYMDRKGRTIIMYILVTLT